MEIQGDEIILDFHKLLETMKEPYFLWDQKVTSMERKTIFSLLYASSPRIKASVISRATESLYCLGGVFIK
jgi:hypothetical protein